MILMIYIRYVSWTLKDNTTLSLLLNFNRSIKIIMLIKQSISVFFFSYKFSESVLHVFPWTFIVFSPQIYISSVFSNARIFSILNHLIKIICTIFLVFTNYFSVLFIDNPKYPNNYEMANENKTISIS